MLRKSSISTPRSARFFNSHSFIANIPSKDVGLGFSVHEKVFNFGFSGKETIVKAHINYLLKNELLPPAAKFHLYDSSAQHVQYNVNIDVYDIKHLSNLFFYCAKLGMPFEKDDFPKNSPLQLALRKVQQYNDESNPYAGGSRPGTPRREEENTPEKVNLDKYFTGLC